MRALNDWLDSYIEYTQETESASIFHKWVGVSMIGSALRRKVWFNFGRIKVYPNLFVVLVAEPGIARKTQAISYGEDLLVELPEIKLSADAITPEALLQDLESAADQAVMPDNTTLTHSSLAVMSGEFESFLGQRKENTKMLVTLTDLFDCKSRPFTYRTKQSGSSVIPHPFMNMIAATTPESLASALPSTAIGGGLTSRIIFIWAGGKSKKIDVPEITSEMIELNELLLQDLSVIARITGGYNFSKESRQWWGDYYSAYDERGTSRICKDPTFNGWYSRKPVFILKVGTILAASHGQSLTIENRDFERAVVLIEEAERYMGNAFSAVGRSEITADVDLVRKTVEKVGTIHEKKLLQLHWRDVDAKKFENVMATLVKGGMVLREFIEVKGKEPEIWYHSVKKGGGR